jgi:hypothetical protein
MRRKRNHTALSRRVTHAVAMIIAALVLAGILQICAAGAADDGNTELAKKTQNPVADLISVPFQNNFNLSAGSNDATIYILNVQPVIPLKLTEDWNLITRTIMPIINQPSLFEGSESAFGLGDINPTFFLSPAKPGQLIWGVGSTFTLPTATDSLLGTSQWSMGPAAVALTMQGPWVVGALANQQWSFAGWRDQDVSQLLIQPFVNYNLPDAWYLVSAPIITANWGLAVAISGPCRWVGVRGSCSSWTSSRSTPSCRPSTMWSGPTWRRTGSCASSSSFPSPNRLADTLHQSQTTWAGGASASSPSQRPRTVRSRRWLRPSI